MTDNYDDANAIPMLGAPQRKADDPARLDGASYNKRTIWRTQAQQLVYAIGTEDPRKVVLDAIGDGLTYIPEIYGAQVLVATAPSPNKRGSILTAPKTIDEGKYQGKVGLILGWGPNAFKYDPTYPNYSWEGVKPSVLDWVFYKASDTWECGINGVSCRFIEDANIRGRVTDIEVIW